MTTPGETNAGRLYVEVEADASGFSRGLQRKIDTQVAKVRARIQAQIDTTGLRRDTQDRVNANLKGVRASVGVDADTRGLSRQVREAAKLISETVRIKIRVEVDERRLAEDIQTAADRTRAPARVQVDADTAEATAKTEAFRKAAGRDVTVRIKTNKNEVERIGKLLTQMSKFPAIASGILLAGGALTNVVGGLFAITGEAGRAVGLLGLIPNLLLTAGQGALGLFAGLSGIGAALKAEQQQNTAGAASSQSAAKAREAAAERVRSAQVRLADAYRQADDTAEQGAEKVRDARLRLADVEETAAKAVAAAERDVTQAQQEAAQAQADLNQARVDAREKLEDLRLQLVGAALDEEGATLAVERAKQNLDKALADDTFSNLQKREADLAYREAVQRLAEIKESNDDLNKSSAVALRAGVEGAADVVNAKNKLIETQQKEAESAAALRDAQVSGAHDIFEAQRDVGKAQEQAAKDNADAARTIAEAQHDLTRAIREQTEAVDTQTTSTRRLDAALANLSPAGQRFVKFLQGRVLPALKQIRFAAQTALLPPLQRAMERLLVLGPGVAKALAGAGKAMGQAAEDGAKLATSPAWRRDFGRIAETNNKVIAGGGKILINLAAGLKDIAVAASPWVEKLTKYLVDLSKSLRDYLAKERAIGERDPHKGISGYFERAWDAARRVKNIVRDLLIGLGNLFSLSAPSGRSGLKWLEDAAANFRKFTGDPKNAAKIRGYFDKALPVLRKFAGLLGDVVGLLVRLGNATGGDTLDGLLGVLKGIVTALEFLAGLPGAGTVLTVLFTLAGAGFGLGLVATAVGRIGRGLGTIGKLTGLSKLFDLLKPGGKGGRGKTRVGDLAGDVDDLTGAIKDELPHDKKKKTALDDIGTAADGAGTKTRGAGKDAEGMGKAAEKSAKRSAGLIGVLKGIGKAAGAATAVGTIVYGLNKAVGAIFGGAGPLDPSQLGPMFAPLKTFFVKTIPGWAKAANKFITQYLFGGGLRQDLIDGFFAPVGRFFTDTIPRWAKQAAGFISQYLFGGGLRADILHGLGVVFSPVGTFFTQTLPGWAKAGWTDASEASQGALASLGTMASRATGAIAGGLTKARDVAGNLLGGIVTHASNARSRVLGWLGDAGGRASAALNTGLGRARDAAGGIFAGIGRLAGGARDTIVSKLTEAGRTAGSGLLAGLTNARSLAGRALSAIGESFSSAVSAIGAAWNVLRNVVAAPVRFIVNTVYNQGIRAAWNKVAGLVGAPQLGEVKGFAEGGVYPGYTPGQDIGVIAVSGGEAIMRPEFTRAVGPAAIDEANAAARAGGVNGVLRYLGGFDAGGIVGRVGRAISGGAGRAKDAVAGIPGALKDAVVGGLAAAFKAAVAPLRRVVASTLTGSPYQAGLGSLVGSAFDRLIGFLGKKDESQAGAIWQAGVPANVAGNAAIVQRLAASMYGWTGVQWESLYQLLMGESGFNNNAQNPTSSAYGMFQFLDNTWAGVGGRKTSDPTLQTVYGLRYIAQSYGNPVNAYSKWSSRSPHWYDQGGVITEPIIGVGASGELYGFGGDGPETVIPGTASSLYRAGAGMSLVGRQPAPAGAGRPVTINVYPQQGQDEQEIAAAVSRRLAGAVR